MGMEVRMKRVRCDFCFKKRIHFWLFCRCSTCADLLFGLLLDNTANGTEKSTENRTGRGENIAEMFEGLKLQLPGREKITANKTGRGGNIAGMFVGSKLQQVGLEKKYITANKTGRGGNIAGMFVGSKLQRAGRGERKTNKLRIKRGEEGMLLECLGGGGTANKTRRGGNVVRVFEGSK